MGSAERAMGSMRTAPATMAALGCVVVDEGLLVCVMVVVVVVKLRRHGTGGGLHAERWEEEGGRVSRV